MTCSTGCGSGWFAGDTGVHMNNMLGESDLALATRVLRPSDRITSMMSPTLVLGADGPIRLVVGSSGSARIRSAVTQVLDARPRRQHVAAGLRRGSAHPPGGRAARLRGRVRGRRARRPRGAGERVVRWPGRNLYFGGAQAVAAHPGGRLEAAGDPRRGGAGRVVARRSRRSETELQPRSRAKTIGSYRRLQRQTPRNRQPHLLEQRRSRTGDRHRWSDRTSLEER